MIAKPTTREQALKNAISAAEAADTACQRLRAPDRAPTSWAHTAQAWAAVAALMPEVPGSDEDPEKNVVIPLHTFEVMKAIIVTSLQREIGEDEEYEISNQRVNALSGKDLVFVQNPRTRAWTVSVRDIVR